MTHSRTPTHLRSTHENPLNLTPYFDSNNYLPATNPSISVSTANRTFGGNSSSSFSSQVSGVKGYSQAILLYSKWDCLQLQFEFQPK